MNVSRYDALSAAVDYELDSNAQKATVGGYLKCSNTELNV